MGIPFNKEINKEVKNEILVQFNSIRLPNKYADWSFDKKKSE
jgi:hypothetical protein